MTLALIAKISVDAAALREDERLHALAHEFLMARIEAAHANGAQAWTYPLTVR